MKFLFLISLLYSLQAFSHTEFELFKEDKKLIASISTQDYLGTLKIINEKGIDIAGVDYKEKIIDVVIGDHEYLELKSLGLDLELTFVQGVSSLVDSQYFSPSEIEQELLKISKTYPHLTKMVSIGKSFEGRDIWALKISDNPMNDEKEEPSVLFNSMHHAREVMTPEIGIDIARFLTENYEEDSKVKHWVDSNVIWVVPMLNVDGNAKVWSGRSMWRKNTAYGHGVDINRNYPYMWGSCRGSSGATWSDTYRGPSAGSEKEVHALMNLVKEARPVFDLSYHSYSELIIYPFGCRGERSAQREVVEGLGKELGEILDYKPGTAWELLYSVDGGDIDWMHEEYQVLAYCAEVNSRSQGFHPDYDRWRDVTVERNRKGWQLLLDKLDGPGVRGLIESQDEINMNELMIVVKNDKEEVIQEYKVNPNGSFHIILNPGAYSFTLINPERVELATAHTEVESARQNIQFQL